MRWRLDAGRFRKVFPYLWIPVGMAAVHVAWLTATRQSETRRMEEASRARAERRQEWRGRLYPIEPGFRILQFYASPPVITEGEHAVVCYGVQDARAVRLEPAVEELKPSFNRCFAVTPRQTTTYKLIADADDGRRTFAAFTLPVKPAPPWIFFFATSEKEIRRGEPFTFCYGVRYTDAVRLEPLGWTLPVVEKNCAKMYPPKSARYRLLATRQGAGRDVADFRVTVK